MVVVRTITILRNHCIVSELHITKTLVEPDIEMIKANAILTDGSMLYVSEIIGDDWRDYSYHWQRDGRMLRRWDNAPHHKELPSFPHHVHDENSVLSGDDVNLADILSFIETKLKKQN